MATIVRAWVLGKWTLSNNYRSMAIADAYPAVDQGGGFGGWADYTGQPDSDLSVLPVFVAVGEITAAQLTSIQADNRFLVVAQANVDTVTGVQSGGNFGATLTQLQVNAVWSWIQTNWPGVPASMQTKLNTLVGLTRKQAADQVLTFIQNRVSAGV